MAIRKYTVFRCIAWLYYIQLLLYTYISSRNSKVKGHLSNRCGAIPTKTDFLILYKTPNLRREW